MAGLPIRRLASIVVACGLLLGGGVVALVAGPGAESASQFQYVAVYANSFRAVAAGGRTVRLTWRSSLGAGIVGFKVWRGGRRVNGHLIPAHAGAAYRFVDRRAPAARPLRYRLQVVLLDGRSKWVGTAVVR